MAHQEEKPLIQHRLTTYRSEDLVPGFVGKSCRFELQDFNNRSLRSKSQYLKLKENLLAHGMKHPLFTYRGHILVGMRRFEILKDHQSEFPCIEVLEDVIEWTNKDISRFQAFRDQVYGKEASRKFMG